MYTGIRGDLALRKTCFRSNISWVLVIGLVAGYVGWQYTSDRIEQSTFSRLNSGLYHAMVFTERNGQRTYRSEGRYYYANLYDPANFSMAKSYLTHYIQAHDPSVALKTIIFRMPDSHNVIGLATVGVPVLPGVTVNVELNDTISLFHFPHSSGLS